MQQTNHKLSANGDLSVGESEQTLNSGQLNCDIS